MLKVKLQYYGHLMRRVDSLEKTIMLGGPGGRRRRGWQRMRCFDGITESVETGVGGSGVGDGQGGLVCCNSWGRKELDTTKWLNWTELNWDPYKSKFEPLEISERYNISFSLSLNVWWAEQIILGIWRNIYLSVFLKEPYFKYTYQTVSTKTK